MVVFVVTCAWLCCHGRQSLAPLSSATATALACGPTAAQNTHPPKTEVTAGQPPPERHVPKKRCVTNRAIRPRGHYLPCDKREL